MRFLCFALAVAFTIPSAHASDEKALSKAISKCWNPPASMREARNLDAMIDEQGGGKFRVPGHDTTKIASDLVADSLLRAAMRCAPYDVPPGRYRLTVTPHDPFEG
jgi:hypothetical protein